MKIIALGNRLRGDDGLGPFVLDRLKKLKSPVPLKLIEAGADAFTLLEHLTADEPMIVIDCADMGLAPGSIRVINVDQNFVRADQLISLHGFSFAEILSMARSLGKVAPCKIIGVQPQSTTFGESLSQAVKEALPEVTNLIFEEAKRYAKKNLNH